MPSVLHILTQFFDDVIFRFQMGRDEGVWRGQGRSEGWRRGGPKLLYQEYKQAKNVQKIISNIRRVNAGEDYDHHYRRKSR